jgi:hypothetical protein
MDLGRFREAFFDVRRPRGQAPKHEHAFEHVRPTAHGRDLHTKLGRQVGVVLKLRRPPRQKPQQLKKSAALLDACRRDDVALDVREDEIVEDARRIAGCGRASLAVADHGRPRPDQNAPHCHVFPAFLHVPRSARSLPFVRMAPSRDHEVPLALLAERVDLAQLLWRAMERRAGPGRVELAKASASPEDVRPLLPDAVWVLKSDDERVRRAIAMEVQRRWDAEKPRTWGAIVGTLQGQHRCPVDLLVLTGSRGVKRKLERPIRYGAITVHPVLVTPRDLLAIAGAHADRDVRDALTVIALRVDQGDLDAKEVLELLSTSLTARESAAFSQALRDAFLACGERLGPPHLEQIQEALMLDISMVEDGSIVASQQARRLLAEFGRKKEREGRQEGRVEAKREGLLRALERRFGPVTEHERALLACCSDVVRIDHAMDTLVDGAPRSAVFRCLDHDAPSE